MSYVQHSCVTCAAFKILVLFLIVCTLNSILYQQCTKGNVLDNIPSGSWVKMNKIKLVTKLH